MTKILDKDCRRKWYLLTVSQNQTQYKGKYELRILLLAKPNIDHPKPLTWTAKMPLIFISRLEPALLLVAFAVLDVAVVGAVVLGAVVLGVAVATLPLPPIGVALAEVTVDCAPFAVLVVPAVVDAATPLAGACKIFPTDAHIPALLSNPA